MFNGLHPLELEGIDGSNPAGFLAALGVLATICRDPAHAHSRLSWQETTGVWKPIVHCDCETITELSQQLAEILRCPFTPDAAAQTLREQRQKSFDNKRTELKTAREELKRKKLRGKERDVERLVSVAPLEIEVGELRAAWLVALKACVPSSELSLVSVA